MNAQLRCSEKKREKKLRLEEQVAKQTHNREEVEEDEEEEEKDENIILFWRRWRWHRQRHRVLSHPDVAYLNARATQPAGVDVTATTTVAPGTTATTLYSFVSDPRQKKKKPKHVNI